MRQTPIRDVIVIDVVMNLVPAEPVLYPEGLVSQSSMRQKER